MDIAGKIREHLKGISKGIDVTTISDDDSLWQEGVIDSLGMLEFMAFVESEFHIKIDSDELIPENFDSVRNISKYVESKIASGS